MCIASSTGRCIAETIGHRSGSRCACNLEACNRCSAGDKKPAENEIRITVVGRDRIMADNDELGGASATSARSGGITFSPPFSPFLPFLYPSFPCLRFSARTSRAFIAYRDFHTKLRPITVTAARSAILTRTVLRPSYVWVHQPFQQ